MGRGLAALLALAAAVAGCGGSPRPVRHVSDASVIRRWADTLRSGDVAGAARLFAVPATVENGEPPLRLRSRAAVTAFNRSLPCGARLLRTRRRGRYTVATFRLTDRRGGDCGSGVGATAATAFRIRGGRIVEWLRVPTSGAPVGPPPDTGTA